MNFLKTILLLSAVGIVACCCRSETSAEEVPQRRVDFVPGNGHVAVVIDGTPVVVYCYQSEKILRPFFTDVRTLHGVQVTRHHPPIAGFDLVDHDTMHPGIWLAFGDISGADFWRNKARVEHVEFVDQPQGGANRGSFAVHNRYVRDADASENVCSELASYTFLVRPNGYVVLWDSTFSSNREFAFGDQEEMGLGFRIATPLRVGASGAGKLPPGTGTIANSAGGQNEAGVWGKAADWCGYSGTLAGHQVGITIFCHPGNFGPTWFHARDYGLLVANPFGRNAFRQGEKSSIVVRPGNELRLRYGIFIHDAPQDTPPDLPSEYQNYSEAAGK